MQIYNSFTIIFIFIVLGIIIVEGDFECFRKHRTRRRKQFCKGPIKNKRRYNTPEKCCAKKGQGFAMGLSKVGKNKYRCTPCSALIPSTTTPRPDWGEWTGCSSSCGAGWRSRYRMCVDCDQNKLENVQSEPCMKNFYCPVDGNWGPWLTWHACTVSCDGGLRRRERRCNYPPPTHGGKNCPGNAEKEQSCNEEPCPVDGNWGPWARFSMCSVTCGPGSMSRTRECDHPRPQNGGRDCSGKSRESRRCTNRNCPQHGGWSLWSSWTKCPVKCGTGVRERKRTCDSPRALYGGRPCEGSGEDTQECNAGRPCPIHGQWSSWTSYGHCRAPRCEKGYQMRSRSCVNPRPQHGGRPCIGRHIERSECINTINCPSQGEWCPWNEWSSCTATCTGLNSMQVRQRSCRCPEPNAGGQSCEGESFQVRECENVPPCNRNNYLATEASTGVQTDGSGDGSKPSGDQEDEQDRSAVTQSKVVNSER